MLAEKDKPYKTLPASSMRDLAYRAITAGQYTSAGNDAMTVGGDAHVVAVGIESLGGTTHQPVLTTFSRSTGRLTGTGVFVSGSMLTGTITLSKGAALTGGGIAVHAPSVLGAAVATTYNPIGGYLRPAAPGDPVSESFMNAVVTALGTNVAIAVGGGVIANLVDTGGVLAAGSFTVTEVVQANTQQQTENSRGEAVLSRWAWLQQRLLTWAKLQADWDGEDGQPPNPRVVGSASHFLSRAQIAGALLPEPYIAGDGEVGYRWRGEDKFASAAFLPDGHIVAFARSPNQPTYRLDEPYVADLELGDFFHRLKEFA